MGHDAVIGETEFRLALVSENQIGGVPGRTPMMIRGWEGLTDF